MNYVRDVTDLFITRCSNVTILSPTDFTIIAEWEKQEIPVEVILRSINEHCDGQSKNGIKIESIADFQPIVKQNYIDWLKAIV